MLMVMTGAAKAADQPLLLAVQVNGYDTGKVGQFTLRDGVLLSQRSELTDLGFKVPDSVADPPDGLIALSALSGLSWHLDLATESVAVTAANDRLLPTLLQAGGKSGGGGPIESGTGATLNYDISGTSNAGQKVESGLFDLRAFSPWGVLSSDVLTYAGGGPNGPGTNTAIRLDSTYTYSDPDSLRRYRLGDFITGGLGWTRPVRLVGIQINSDFSMRPDLVTFPLPSVSGSAAVPSTVDLLVNGNRLLSQQITAGPFQIPQLPVVSGAGTISMTVTNALGRPVSVDLPFYASTVLLAPGLQSYSGQVGLLRLNYGVLSNDYSRPVASMTYRRGVSEMVTLETSAEGVPGTYMGGVGMAVNVGNLGILNLSAAGSSSNGQAGKQGSAGIQRIGRVFSVSASATVADPGFRDVASLNGDPDARLRRNASAGLSLGRFGSLGIAYASIDRDAVPNSIKLFVPPGTIVGQNVTVVNGVAFLHPAQHAHIVSASYSVQVRNVSVSVTGFRDFARGGASGVLFGLTIPLGSRSSASVGAGSGSSTGKYEQVQSQQSAVTIGDWGYQAYAASGNPGHEFAQLQYMTPWALLTAGADRIGRQVTPHVEAQGAISFVDGGLFASNTINDSFAVVDTNGLANVRVLSENRPAGSTDSAGRLLVPDLRSFDNNHIAIDPEDIPPDTSIPVVAMDVRPQDRSGVVVKFPVQVSHGALLLLVDAAGKPLPVGSTATLKATGVIYPIGFDGDAYILDLSEHNALAVELPKGERCGVAFDYRPVLGDIPSIGPLKCLEQKP
jgi:outer membrane usher protein